MRSFLCSTENGEENSTTQARTLDVVTEIKSGNNTVTYEYDKKRRVTSVSLNGVDNYVSYAYSGDNTNTEKVTATMADGTVATTTKNAHGNVTKSTCGNRTVNNTYNANQQLTKVVDSVSGETALTYDDKGNVVSVTAADHSEDYTYDVLRNTLESKTITGNGIDHTYWYSYKSTADHALENICIDNNTVSPHMDVLGRNTGKTIAVDENKIAEEKISYVKFGDHATSLPSGVRFATNGLFTGSVQYKYDAMGNIIEVLENGRCACRYEYDALGRLTREDNIAFAKTTTWAYDNNGNILTKYVYALTAKPTSELHLLDCTCKLYAYDDNSDRLMSYDGETFAYDIIGNPTTYRGKTATWAYGRQLTAFDGITFSYDARGRRTAKNGITFTYDSNGNLIKQSNGLEFLYDHTGVFAVKYNGSTYYYRKNAQQDVIALLDNSGSVVAKYKYDAWGKCQTTVIDSNASIIAELNPFRYRSYYYDTETNLYFLKTRYYDPETGRFMTIDDLSYLDPDTINGLNLYAYGGNNPVMNVDKSGNIGISIILIGCLIAFAVGSTASVISQGFQYGWDNISVGQVLVDGLFAAVSVALAVTGISFIASVGIGAVMGFGQHAIGSAFHGESLTLEGAIIATALGAIGGAISGAGAKNLKTIASIYDNMTGRSAQGFKALITAAQKYGLGSKQITFVNNLYGKVIQTAVDQGIEKAFIKSVIKINFTIIGNLIATPLANERINEFAPF